MMSQKPPRGGERWFDINMAKLWRKAGCLSTAIMCLSLLISVTTIPHACASATGREAERQRRLTGEGGVYADNEHPLRQQEEQDGVVRRWRRHLSEAIEERKAFPHGGEDVKTPFVPLVRQGKFLFGRREERKAFSHSDEGDNESSHDEDINGDGEEVNEDGEEVNGDGENGDDWGEGGGGGGGEGGRRGGGREKRIMMDMGENGDSSSLEGGGGGGLLDGFLTSFCIIVVSEIGDETFIIAALMAMRHPRGIVLAGGLAALFLMTVLSTALGFVVPNLISRKHTNNAATILYTFFGLRLLYIAWRADSKGATEKEVDEVEDKLEGGTTRSSSHKKSVFRAIAARFCTPIFLESFILIFLAEWGDRSQIATIALASHKDPIGVTLGAFLGHFICTSVAVIGGRLLALKISQRSVATIGSFLFLAFAVHSYVHPPLE